MNIRVHQSVSSCHLYWILYCRDWVVDKGLYNYPTTCKDPERLSDKMWDVVQSNEFACKVRSETFQNTFRIAVGFVSSLVLLTLLKYGS